MHIDLARERKAHWLTFAREVLITPETTAAPVAVAVGLAVHDGGEYGLAVRYRDEAECSELLGQIAETEPEADIRHVGQIVAQSLPPGRPGPPQPPQPPGSPGPPGPPGQPEPPGGQVYDRRARVRPLRPGVSIANANVTAGTLGAFVTDSDGMLYALSNWHVLAGSTTAVAGDPILQPGPADGGASGDQVGTLDRMVPLDPGRPNTVDAALALLTEVPVDAAYPIGAVTSTARADGGEQVGKVGRTTGITVGRVTAVELDGVQVSYGEELGEVTFDNQIEVTGDVGAFSAGGDSGSLVYREDGVAVGLLFAGSETGGPAGAGLTFVNPIDDVLRGLEVGLLQL